VAHNHPQAEIIASALARMGARTTTIGTILKAPSVCGASVPAGRMSSLIKRAYRETVGQSSHPGLMPSAITPFFKSDRQIMHASMILALAWAWRQRGPEDAFARAYSIYWGLTGGDRTDVSETARAISADQAWLLVQRSLLPMQRWVEGRAKGYANVATPEIRLLRCRSCGIPVIAAPVDLRVTCPVCRQREQAKTA
jgi:hypothetical protein